LSSKSREDGNSKEDSFHFQLWFSGRRMFDVLVWIAPQLHRGDEREGPEEITKMIVSLGTFQRKNKKGDWDPM
jgi:hypothetical protein